MENKSREKLLVVAAVCCVLALVGDRMLLTPLLGAWKSRSDRITLLKRDLQTGYTLKEQKESLGRSWAEMRTGCLPAAPSAAESQVLQAMDRWSRESRLALSSQKVRWGREENGFQKVEFRAAGEGSLEAVSRFLYELEVDPLALKLEETELTARDDAGRRLTLSARFTGLLLKQDTKEKKR